VVGIYEAEKVSNCDHNTKARKERVKKKKKRRTGGGSPVRQQKQVNGVWEEREPPSGLHGQSGEKLSRKNDNR